MTEAEFRKLAGGAYSYLLESVMGGEHGRQMLQNFIQGRGS